MVGPDDVARWTAAWAISRGAPAPVAQGGALYVHVGAPDQAGRYVFPTVDPELIAATARSVTAPDVFLKILADEGTVRRMLPPRWTLRPPGYMMALGALPAMPRRRTLPAGYALHHFDEDGVQQVHILHRGEVAARGRVLAMGDMAVFDRIRTEAGHGRRGLGSVVMGALADVAVDAGADRALLVATPQGRALYATLGWRDAAPYTTAVIERAA